MDNIERRRPEPNGPDGDGGKPQWRDIQRYLAFAIIVSGMVYNYVRTMETLSSVDVNIRHRLDAIELKVDTGVMVMKQYGIDEKERRRQNAFNHANYNYVPMIDCRRCMGGR